MNYIKNCFVCKGRGKWGKYKVTKRRHKTMKPQECNLCHGNEILVY